MGYCAKEDSGHAVTAGRQYQGKKMRVEDPNEMKRSRKRDWNSSSEKVLTPRHKDLEAGFWTRAQSTRNLIFTQKGRMLKQKLFTNYSQVWPRHR